MNVLKFEKERVILNSIKDAGGIYGRLHKNWYVRGMYNLEGPNNSNYLMLKIISTIFKIMIDPYLDFENLNTGF